MHIGRIISTAVVGLLFFLFVAVDLVLFGVVNANSVLVTILLAIGLVGGGLLGFFVGKRRAGIAVPTASSN